MNAGVLILAALFGLAGYQEARRFQKQYGRTPWGWDPWVWAIIMFLSFLIGVILIAIAERQGRKNPVVAASPYAPGPGQMQYGAVGQPSQAGAASGPSAPGSAFWAPDPSGRFEYRWWNGQQWTDAVSTGGVQSRDAATPGQ